MKIVISLKPKQFGEPRQFWCESFMNHFHQISGTWYDSMKYATIYDSWYKINPPICKVADLECIVLNDNNEAELCLTYDEAFAMLLS